MNITGNGVYGARLMKPSIGINLDFKNPVNQRGIVSGASNTLTDAYWLDMWKANGTVTWTQGTGITLASETSTRQYFEVDYNELLGKTYTVSLTVDGEIKTATLAFPAAVDSASVTASATVTGVCTVELGFEYRSDGTLICDKSQQYVPFIRLTALAAFTVSRIKIERGTYSTMAWDAPVDYGAEFLKCQRFYCVISRPKFIAISGALEWPAIQTYFPVRMRTTPTSNWVVGLSVIYPYGIMRTVSIATIAINDLCITGMQVSPSIYSQQANEFVTPATFSADL